MVGDDATSCASNETRRKVTLHKRRGELTTLEVIRTKQTRGNSQETEVHGLWTKRSVAMGADYNT